MNCKEELAFAKKEARRLKSVEKWSLKEICRFLNLSFEGFYYVHAFHIFRQIDADYSRGELVI